MSYFNFYFKFAASSLLQHRNNLYYPQNESFFFALKQLQNSTLAIFERLKSTFLRQTLRLQKQLSMTSIVILWVFIVLEINVEEQSLS